jgi:hypothetical protein
MPADRGFPGARKDTRQGLPIVLRAVESTAGQATIDNMAQVLPPE